MNRKSSIYDTAIRWCDVNADGKNLYRVEDETTDMVLFGPARWVDCVSWRRANTLPEHTVLERAVLRRSEERGMAVDKIALDIGSTPKLVAEVLNRALRKKARRAEMRNE